jgi:hypothetical protein
MELATQREYQRARVGGMQVLDGWRKGGKSGDVCMQGRPWGGVEWAAAQAPRSYGAPKYVLSINI